LERVDPFKSSGDKFLGYLSIAVTSLPAATEAAALLSKQVANVVVTAGGLGLAVTERGNTPYAEAAHPVKLVDTHGAGDAFIGALAARWACGVLVAEAVRMKGAQNG